MEFPPGTEFLQADGLKCITFWIPSYADNAGNDKEPEIRFTPLLLPAEIIGYYLSYLKYLMWENRDLEYDDAITISSAKTGCEKILCNWKKESIPNHVREPVCA